MTDDLEDFTFSDDDDVDELLEEFDLEADVDEDEPLVLDPDQDDGGEPVLS
jgi:hypothetical protein